MISLTNAADSKEVKLFKRRVRVRHETFFGRMKPFAILNESFRHGVDKHRICFDAIAVICQYMIDHIPLFDA